MNTTLIAVALLTLVPSLAHAAEPKETIDDRCLGKAPLGSDYDEQTQQDYLQNYFALGTTLSPIHAPVPHEAGRGAIGVDLLVLPPVTCAHRFVLNATKTEYPNKAPVAPRPRVSFAFDGPGELVPYAGFAYLPPVTVGGVRTVLVGGEVGVGAAVGKAQVGGRVHASMVKTVGDIATSFDPAVPPAYDDLFLASTFGFDAMGGVDLGDVTPYVALGLTDASTIFIVGDDNVVSSNLHPYTGPTMSLGADGLYKRLRVGGEFYAAPWGGLSDPKTADGADVVREPCAGTCGAIYTARLRVGVEL